MFIQGFAPAGATRGLCDRPLDSFASPSKLLDFCRNKLACEPFVPPSRNKNQETWVCTPNVSKGRPQTFVCFYCPLVASAEAKPLRQSQIANKIKGVCSHTQRGRNPSAAPYCACTHPRATAISYTPSAMPSASHCLYTGVTSRYSSAGFDKYPISTRKHIIFAQLLPT